MSKRKIVTPEQKVAIVRRHLLELERAETALALFDGTQNAAEIWRGSNNRVRREILDAVCLNRTLTDLNLDATKRKPFDVFAKGLEIKNSRGERI